MKVAYETASQAFISFSGMVFVCSLYHWYTLQLALILGSFVIAMSPLPCIALGGI